MGWLMAMLLSVMVGSLPASAASPQASMVSSDPEILALGSRLFEQNCSPCHGKQAVGENPATPLGGWKVGVGQVAPALNGTGHAWHHPPSYHVRIIRDGSTLEGSRMIGWGNHMSDFDIFAVIAYFQSLWPVHIKAAYQQRHLYRVWK
jgi:mono/diheme cytochrome c family protein